VINAFAIDRFSYLLGARGAHDAFGFVKAQALLLERYAAIIE
jgi:hypothetical protein